MIERLFVYGTLRQGSRNSRFHMLAGDAQLVGRARMQGTLYDLGGYPGLVPSRAAAAWVHGDVYTLARPPTALARLDAYERCSPNDPEPHEFERAMRRVLLESGESDRVWVYLYRGSLSTERVIPSGDYLK